MHYKKIGVIVADKDEYKPFADAVKTAKPFVTPFKDAIEFTCGKTQVIALLCGIGKVNAAACAMYLVDSGCDLIFNYGLSGGLSGVKRGEYILPEKFLEHDFDLTPLGYKPCEKPRQKYVYNADGEIIKKLVLLGFVSGGTAVCGDRFISSSKDSEFLIRTFAAKSCDMETAAIASVCDMAGVPFVSLRRISDSADDGAAASYNDMNNNKDEGMSLSAAFLKCLKTICEA